MTDSQQPARLGSPGQITVLEFFALLAMRFRLVAALGFGFAAIAAFQSITGNRQFVSSAMFVPEEGGSGSAGLIEAARQLGVAGAGSRQGWVPALFVEVARSRPLLLRMAADTLVIPEMDRQRVALVDLFEISPGPPQERLADLARYLGQKVISVSELKGLGAVRISASTRWPSVSQHLATRQLDLINEFNLGARQTRGGFELRFVESRVKEAERTLRDAEDRLTSFLQRNSGFRGNPSLEAEHQRLTRSVALQNQIYTATVSNREDARLRKIRDTPVITVIETPAIPVVGEPRSTIFRTLLGGLGGGILAIALIILRIRWETLRTEESEAFNRLVSALQSLVPKILRRGV
jgi:hypothetical protein